MAGAVREEEEDCAAGSRILLLNELISSGNQTITKNIFVSCTNILSLNFGHFSYMVAWVSVDQNGDV
jgi:hypothetical protein